jgi:hypothetical protein
MEIRSLARPKLRVAGSCVAFAVAILTVSVVPIGGGTLGLGGEPECPKEACDIEWDVCVSVDIETRCADGASAGDRCTGSEKCESVD